METEHPPPNGRIPELSPFENKLLGTVIFGALGVGSLGLYSSYDSVSAAAIRWGFNPPWILPVSLDTAIPVFSLGYLLLVRFDMALTWVRFVPWVLTLATVYLNVVAAGANPAAKVGHGALPLLWVVCSEIAAHVYRVLIGHATGKRMERVRRSRWILAPVSTARLWRRMVLWEVKSYRTGLQLESRRLMARAELRDNLGWGWRRKVKRVDLVRLRAGELEPAAVPEQDEEGPVDPMDPRGLGSRDLVDLQTVPVESPPAPLEPIPVPAESEPELEVDPIVEREPEPSTGTADLPDRASKKEQQVIAVLELMKRHGMERVTPKFVKEQIGIPASTAHRRIQEAKERLERNGPTGTSGTERPRNGGTMIGTERTGS